MKSIVQYIRCYFFEINKSTLIAVSLFTATLVFINYHLGLDNYIRKNNTDLVKLLAWYVVFLLSFSIPYFITGFFKSVTYLKRPVFLFLLLTAPLVFAIKLSFGFTFFITKDPYLNSYWNHIIEWPLLLLIIASIVFLIWKFFDKDQPLYGLSSKNLDWKPYLLMILIMIPLIAAASTQADFLSMYPKLHTIAGVDNENEITWWHKLLFELSYGSDFISIELFFRGFLILAFIKWAGKDAILPMACFYCTIHFGKPLGECISSYFGGIILGVVVYHTRSIYGGLLVHLGIAWLMELGGYIGNTLN